MVLLISSEVPKGHQQHTCRGQEGFNSDVIFCHDHSIYVTDRSKNHVDELGNDGRHIRQLIRGQGMRLDRLVCVDDTG